MWRNNIIDAPDLDSAEKVIRLLDLQPETHRKLFSGLITRKR
ncbi:hypothetical protein [Bacillus thuringiensis]|nr:hypothetical protein [Bacillus thuringiensis]MED2097764.1 hypothetical protein [Bacillus thuringiensis]MED2401520.1 hypothetical protein [Bacillus thuringiensis]